MNLFSSCIRAFRVTVSVVVSSGRLFAALVLGAVCIGVDGLLPVLRCTLYSGALGCAPNPFSTVSRFRYCGRHVVGHSVLCKNKKHLPLTVKNSFLCLLLRQAYGHPPRRRPGSPVMGVVRPGRFPSRLHGRQDRATIRLS